MINNKLKVVVAHTPPFIIESNGKYSGFEIELWETIAKEIGASFEYEKHNFQELISLIADKKADIALAAITVNEKREEIIDFSHPTFNSGLHILLSKNRKNIDFTSTIKTFFTQGYKQLIKPLFVLLIIVFIFGNILWLAEKSGDSIASTYFPGVFQTTWMALSIIIGSDGGLVDVYRANTWTGRLILTLGQLINLAVLGLLIGSVTAFITTRKILSNIEGPNDLRGKTVATVQGTTSESILKNLGATVMSVIKIDEAYEKLKKNEVEAVVFDAPVLVYYAFNDGAGWAEVVGELFDKQDYAVVLPEHSILREVINRAILTVRENGYYNTLHRKWFGETE